MAFRRTHLPYVLILFCGLAVRPLTAQERESGPEATEFFESRIRPVLVQECYECHRTGGERKGGLALDHRAGILEGGESGPAVTPGDAGSSLLLQAIRHEHEELKMPKNGARLPDRVLADFETWIQSGAFDPRDEPAPEAEVARFSDWESIRQRRQEWWSFQPIQPAEPPDAPDEFDSGHPVDRFIAAQWENQGLKPSGPANREALIRRLSFNLRGLPPTPEEIEDFLADTSPDAYEQRVDRFLNSPQFGERWARHWMDWFRYAESHGSEGDPTIPNAWRYRDYLIRALNADVPYDQMVLEHVAGDLLEQPRINESLSLNESAIGPVQLRMVFHGFAPTDALEELVRFTDDQIDVVSKAFMGLTVSCARCHDHKFDPISQKDYYAWYGIFSSVRPAMIRADMTPLEEDRWRDEMGQLREEIRAQLTEAWLSAADELKQRLLQPDPMLREQIQKEDDPLLWPVQLLDQQSESFSERWQQALKSVTESDAQSSDDAVIQHWDFRQGILPEGWMAQGPTLGAPVSNGLIALSPEGDPVAVKVLPPGVYSLVDSPRDRGVLHSPQLDLDGEYDLWLRMAGDGGAMARYAVQHYPRDGTVYPVERLNDGEWRWKRFPLSYWKGDLIHVELTTAADQPVLANTGATDSWFGIQQAMLVRANAGFDPRRGDTLLKPVFENAGDSSPGSVEELTAHYQQTAKESLTAWANGSASDSQILFLDALLQRGWLPNSIEALPQLKEALARYRQLEQRLPVPVRVPGVLETVGRDQPLFDRGNHKKPLDRVPRRFLEVIDDKPYQTRLSGRLQLAQDLLRPDNPLTARVAVNRIWHHLFGQGLVTTPDNFGRLGQPPSHPELLDYLATQFRDNGWFIKSMIRLIVTSETWKRSSEPGVEAVQRDPNNIWLTHYPLRRLEAEAIRDSLLFVSGRLDLDTRYGPPVPGDSSRRSIYVRVKRNDLDPFLGEFDAPVPSSTEGRRDDTNVPGQSLTLLNDPFVLQAAEAWAGRLEEPVGTHAMRDQIEDIFISALGRQPSSDESTAALRFIQNMTEERERFEKRTTTLKKQLAARQADLAQLEETARKRVLNHREISEPGVATGLPSPLAAWNFAEGLNDSTGRLHGELRGTATIRNGMLRLDGKTGYVVTQPLQRDLSTKTLEVWLVPGNLQQQGGGVMSVETTNGEVFDALVFAEQEPRRWLAGSELFRRTSPFGGPEETSQGTNLVHLALVYSDEGSIALYRNGERYGAAYPSNGPVTFKTGESHVLFGNRHGAPGGNRLYQGAIARAALYDRALNHQEIETLYRQTPDFISDQEIRLALEPSERERLNSLRHSIQQLESDLESRRKSEGLSSAWADLAHAMFNLKEFIYIR